MSDYEKFLEDKIKLTHDYGRDIADNDIHPILKPHQREIVRWAVKGGRRAIFAAFGLGKSVIQLETVRLSLDTNGRGLIIAPLGVRQEFKRDAHMLGQEITFVRRTEEVGDPGLYITNYESVRDGKLDPTIFDAVSLDEASILRSFGSKTYQTFLTLFEGVKYRFVATATPSPNRYKELIHYAGYLGVMDTGQALTRFFQRDSTQANNLTLYPHKEREFWLWLHSWAVFVQRPSDLGYSDEGYELPGLEVNWHCVDVDQTDVTTDRDGQAHLFRDAAISLKDAAREKRLTIPARVAKAREILEANPGDHFILWHDLEAERHEITRQIPEAVEVYGSQDLEARENRIIGFSDGEFRVLATKPIIAGSGCNFQRHCHRAIFVGVGFKFNDFIQAIHRLYRFLQSEQVIIDVIYAESETEVVKTLKEKWQKHNELTATMSELIREHGLASTGLEHLTRSIGIERREEHGERWTYANNDTVAEATLMDDNSVDLIVTSIPFSNHYEYTPSYNDFGHTDNNDHFWAQMDYLTPQLLRVLAPGRIYACHVKDRILFGNVTGAGIPTVSPFHAEAINHGIKHGFDYMGMITVVTDVVRENNQTYRLGWTEQCKDGTKMGVGSPEYIILFHKPQTDRTRGYADVPVTKNKADYSRSRWQIDAHAFWRSSGDRALTPEELAQLPVEQRSRVFTDQTLRGVYDYDDHVRTGEILDDKGALPATFMSLAPGSHHPDVWHDVARMRTLNGEQSARAVANHVCLAEGSLVLTKANGYKPIERVHPGELVLTHKGRWREVLARQATGKRPVVKLRAQGVPGAVMTPDHKVWARDPRAFARQSDYLRKVAPDWLEAGDSVGAYVNRKLAPTEEPQVNDAHTWWIIGRWLADGHYHEARNSLYISCGATKLPELEAKLADRAGHKRVTGTATQIYIRDRDKTLRTIIKKCGTGAEWKHLPPEAYTLPVEQAAALLDGYLSGDGHFRADRRRWTASSVSRELMLGIAYLAQRVHGVNASVYAGRPERAGTIEGRDVQMRADWVLSFDLPDNQRRKRSQVLDDGAWMRVRNADDAGEVETWNLRVDEDESFTAEGMIVKNCPLQFDIVDRLITRYSNEGDLIYDPFGGLGTVPVRALKLGRRGRGVELNPDYYRDALYYLRAEERRLSAPSLFDLADLEGAAS